MRRSVHVRHGIRPLAVAVVVTIGLLAAGAAGAASLQRTYLGQVASEELGRAVADAGDVNGDGQGDVIVGVSGFDGSRGRVRVFSGADGAILWTFVGESANDQFGKAVAGNVDVNNDGAPDLIVGAPNRATGNGNGSGKAYVFSGATGALLYSWDGEAALDNFGISVDGAGNVNGGAFDDILVGARNGGANNTGRVYVYSGFNGSLLRGHDGSVADGDFGSALARAGDMTGDGREEYIAGSPFHAGGEGRAYVFDGASGAVLAFMDGEPGFFSRFGYAVSGAGDIDGDGLTEIVVGAWKFNPPPDGDERGKVYVYGLNAVGAPPNLLHTWVGEANQDYFGISVSGAGDTDGDARSDIVVGASGHRGQAYVYSGADGALLAKFQSSDSTQDYYGESVSGAGDVVGNGLSEVIVGEYGFDLPGQENRGAAYVYSIVIDEPSCASLPGARPGSGPWTGAIPYGIVALLVAGAGARRARGASGPRRSRI